MVELIYIVCIISGLLSAELHFFHKKNQRSLSDLTYVFFILFSLWTITVYVFILTKLLNEVPWLYKTGAPVNLLIPPLAYLYTRYILTGQRKMKPAEWLHFIPALLIFFNYLPFYLMPIEHKIDVVRQVTTDLKFQYQSQDGIIPERLYYIIRPAQSLIYIAFQWAYIFKFRKNNSWVMETKNNSRVMRWMFSFTGCLTLIMLSYPVLLLLLSSSQSSNVYNVNLLPSLMMALGTLVINAYFLANPSLFYHINSFRNQSQQLDSAPLTNNLDSSGKYLDINS